MPQPVFLTKEKWCWIVIGMLLFGYITTRAFTVSITHDEVNTCLLYAKMSIYDIVTYKDPIPNNHILHTLLVKLSENLFGTSQFTVRIPNLLGFWVYFAATIAFVRGCSSKRVIRIFAFAVLMLNPFLIDFFSLARGYALAADFMLAACYMSYLWLYNAQTKYLIFALGLSIGAVYANFTTLNFFAPLIALLFFSIIQHTDDVKGDISSKRSFILKHLLILIVGCLILASISYLPIKAMQTTNQFRFWGAKGFYEDTLKTLAYMSIDGINYVKDLTTTVEIFAIVIVGYLGIICVVLSINLWNKGMQIKHNAFAFFTLLLLGAIASVIVQHIVIGTPYVTSRTALFYLPLFALATIFFAEELATFNYKLAKILYIPLTAFIVWHFARTANLSCANEWWYNRDDKVVLNHLKKIYHNSKRTEPIQLDAHWLFLPAFHFYERTENLYWVKIAEWHSDERPNGDAEYYYVTSDVLNPYLKNYEPIMDFEAKSRVLLHKK